MNSYITYDFHSHILPGIDDGSPNVDKSVEIINSMYDIGFRDFSFTPHYYTNEESIESFLLRRNDSIINLKKNISSEIEINIHYGAEVFVTEYLFNQKFDKSICYDNGKYILTEFSYNADFNGRYLKYINNFINMDMIPIIAHVERYPNLIKNYKKMDELLNMGVIFQSNYASFLNSKLKRKLLKLLKNDYISLLGTDVHSMHRNSPSDIIPAQEIIAKKLGVEYLNKIQENSIKIFN